MTHVCPGCKSRSLSILEVRGLPYAVCSKCCLTACLEADVPPLPEGVLTREEFSAMLDRAVVE